MPLTFPPMIAHDAFGRAAEYKGKRIKIIIDRNDDPLADSGFASGAEGATITGRVLRSQMPNPRHGEALKMADGRKENYKIIQHLPDGTGDNGDIWRLTLSE